MTAKTSWLLARLVGTAALLGVLIATVDLSPLRERLHAFRPAWYLGGLAAILVYVVVQAGMLRLLLGSRGQVVRLLDLVRMIVVSSFFGLFLPGGVGADVALGYALFRTAAAKEAVLSAIVFARIATLLGMVAIGLVAGLVPRCPVPGLRLVSLVLLGSGIAGYLVFILAWRRLRREPPAAAPADTVPRRVSRFVIRTLDVLAAFGRDGRTLVRVAPLVLLIGLMRIGIDYLSAVSLGLHPPLVDFLLFTPAVTIATTLPITVAGLGVREGSYIYLFSLVGVSGADALSISLLSFSFTLWVSLIGAVVYVATGLRASVRSAAAQ